MDVEPGELEAGLWGSHDTLEDEIDDAENQLREAEAKESEWNDRQADLEEANELDRRVAEHYQRFYRAANERKDGFVFDLSDLNHDDQENDDVDTTLPNDQDQGERYEATGDTASSKEESDEDEPYRTASQPRTPNQLIEDLERFVATGGSRPLDQDLEDELTAHVVEPAGYSDRNDDVEEKDFDLVLPAIAYPTAFDDQRTTASRHHQLQSRRSSDPELPSHTSTASQSIGRHYNPRSHPQRHTSWSDLLRPTKSPPAGTAVTTAHSIHAIGLGPYGILGQDTQIPFAIATSRPEPIRTEQTVKSENGTFSLAWEENPGTDDADAALPEIFDYVETPSYLNPRDLEDIVQQMSNPPSRNTSGVFGALPAKTRLAAWSWVAEQQKEGEEEEAVGEREDDPPGPPNTLRSGPSSAGHSVPHSPAIEKDFAGLVNAGVDEQDVEDNDEDDGDEDEGDDDDPAETHEQDQDPDPLALSTSAFFPDRQRSYSMPTTTTTTTRTTHDFNLRLHLPTRPDSPYLPHPLSNLSAPEQENFSSHRDSFLLAKQKYQKRPARRSTGLVGGSGLSHEIGRGRGRSVADSANNLTSASPGPGPTIGLTPASTWTEESSNDFCCGSTGSFSATSNRWAGPVGAAGTLERIEDASPPDEFRAQARGWMNAEEEEEKEEEEEGVRGSRVESTGEAERREVRDAADVHGVGSVCAKSASGCWKKAKYLRAEDGTITLRLLDDVASEG
ncbi:hypothetical protein LTR78_000687 [Recurvomyces mirabilis]|uniref:Uncharacterized protein n=1 Tax=Recurvomyces mirabilis TaxID=574656 RepID=A0AAE0WVQ0_9PEZI|nr:hypothetical protein LTR78_000687 [Recurvomyces mirabilis]KAK5158658.1 hypothetical protein LTS14_002765 [Recurvomyces mirabilis]